jgi:CPA2 family monovalent cation:H+ antiporter-2
MTVPDISVLKELVQVLAVTVSIVFLFQKLKLPAIVGFLLVGVIMGPHGLQFIRDIPAVEILAEIGVVLLLFSIGLELSLQQILSLRRVVIWGGILQVLLTIFTVTGLSFSLGFPLEVGIFYGFLVSLSSTAIVLKIYSDRQEMDAPQGRLATGILLLQDLCTIPMMLLVPVLGRSSSLSLGIIGLTFGKAMLAVLLIVVAARFVVPWLLHQVARLDNQEIFTLFVVFLCLGAAWLAFQLGLSLALGAFIAGLLISESEYSHQVISNILPLKDSFSGIFFVSMGMLLDPGFILGDVRTPLLSLLLMVGIKAGVIFPIFWWLYRSPRLGVVLGLGLAQVGEFSFILDKMGRASGLLTEVDEQTFLASSILSMAVSPVLIQWAHPLAFGLDSVLGERYEATPPVPSVHSPVADHVLIVGYGLNGRNLARVLKEVGIPYRIVGLNADAVRRALDEGEPVVFGDGSRPEVLRKLGIDRARVLVVAISDTLATNRIVWHARRLNPEVYIVVRTRYLAEIDSLYGQGVDQVIPEEFETSVEIFARVLQEYHVPRNVISLQVDMIRRERYGMLRGLRLEGKSLDQLAQFLAGTTTDTFLVLPGSPGVGRSLEEVELRSQSGVTVIAAVRDGQSINNPGPDFRFREGDVLVLLGSHKEIDEAAQILSPVRD